MKRHVRHILVCLFCLSPLFSLAQTLTQYEYWFDGKVNDKVTVSLAGSEQTINLDIPTENLDYGMHQLFFRARQSDGQYSSVSRSTFFKLQKGNYDRLEYWLDGDRTNIKKLVGTTTADGIMMAGDFDLTGATEGVHRLYYRATNADETVFSAISMKPVMVKSRYADNGTEGKVTKYSVKVDNVVVGEYDVLKPGQQIVQPYTLDGRNLSDGEHSVAMTFTNNYGISATESSKFNKSAMAEPKITLSATEKDGLVTLRFNSVPNDTGCKLYRVGSDGLPIVVYMLKESSYPNELLYVDNPFAGSYRYYVKMPYEEGNGTISNVKSNELIVSVAKAHQSSDKQGTVVGNVRLYDADGNIVPTEGKYDVVFSDGVTVKTETGGSFYRHGLTIGNVVTATIAKKGGYAFEPAEFTVAKTNVVHIDGKQIGDVEQPNPVDYDLAITKKIQFDDNGIDIEVRNLTYYNWYGNILAFAIEKKAYDKMQKEGKVNVSDDNTKTVGKKYISLYGGKSQSLRLDLSGLPAKGDGTEYMIVLYSMSDKSSKFKHILCDENPYVWTATTEESKALITFQKESLKAFKDILNNLKVLTKFQGPMGLAEELDKAAKDAEKSETWEMYKYHISHASGVLMYFWKDYKTAIKETNDLLKPVKEFTDFAKKVESYQKASGDPNKLFFLIGKELMNTVSKLSGNSILGIYAKYFEAGEKMCEALGRHSDKLVMEEIEETLNAGALSVQMEIYKNKWTDFTGFYEKFDMTQADAHRDEYGIDVEPLLKNASLKVYNNETLQYDVPLSQQYEKDYIKFTMAKNTRIGECKITSVVLYLEWNNGRITRIPLVNLNNAEIAKNIGGRANPIFRIRLQAGDSNFFNIPYKNLKIMTQ